MSDTYDSYEVTEGREQLVSDDDGTVYAGAWQLEQMHNSERITIGHYDDPIRGPHEVAGFPKESLLNHSAISGTTGYGKSTVLRNIQLQLLDHGHGLCFIDSKGLDAQKFLRQIPAERLDDVVWMQPGSENPRTVGFNLLNTRAAPGETGYESEVDSVVEELQSVLKSLTASWSPQLDALTETLLQQLIRADDPSSLLDMKRLLTDEAELDAFIETCEDSRGDTLAEQVAEVTQTDRESLLRQLRLMAENRGIRRALTSDEPAITLSEIVRDDKILIVDTTGLSTFTAGTIIPQAIVARLWSAIQTRRESPPADREPFYLCIDEFPAVATDSSLNSVLMTRSHELGVLCNFQQLAQLPESAQRSMRQTQLQISLNPGRDETQAASIAQMHDVGANRMKTLNPREAVFNPIADSGFQSTEAVDVTLFAGMPPKRDAIEPVIEQSLQRYGSPAAPSTETET